MVSKVERKEFEENRKAMISSFDSKSTGHAAVVISLVVGLGALSSRAPSFFTYDKPETWNNMVVLRCFFYVVALAMLTALVFQIGRMLVWSYMSHVTLHLTPEDVSSYVVDFAKEMEKMKLLPQSQESWFNTKSDLTKMYYAVLYVVWFRRDIDLKKEYEKGAQIGARLYSWVLKRYVTSSLRTFFCSFALALIPMMPLIITLETYAFYSIPL